MPAQHEGARVSAIGRDVFGRPGNGRGNVGRRAPCVDLRIEPVTRHDDDDAGRCDRHRETVVVAPISLNESTAVNEEQHRRASHSKRRVDIQAMFVAGHIDGVRDVFCHIDRREQRKDRSMHLLSMIFTKGRAYLRIKEESA